MAGGLGLVEEVDVRRLLCLGVIVHVGVVVVYC